MNKHIEHSQMPMAKGRRLFFFGAGLFSLVIVFVKIAVHLHFVYLPVFFFFLGVFTCRANERKALQLFLFLLPLVNSLPDLFFNGYPFNAMGTALFYVAGLFLAQWRKGENIDFTFPGNSFYCLLLALIWISVLFVFLRWSNITLSLAAFFRDTPVAPSGERLSFASIFPVVTLFLFSMGPWLQALIRKNRFTLEQVFASLLPGYSLSVGLAALQRFFFADFLSQRWWNDSLGQVNGGFSDFNGLGFFSGICLLISGKRVIDELLAKPRQRRATIRSAAYCFFALTGVILSGSRTAFLFLLAGFFLLLFHRGIRLHLRVAMAIAVAMVFFLAGGQLKNRVMEMLGQVSRLGKSVNLWNSLNEASNARLEMIRQSGALIALNPVSGVGAGNFLFMFKTVHFGKNYYEDMPLNQYLLILDELGAIGLLVFCGFLVVVIRRANYFISRLSLFLIGIVFLFGNPLWLPEGMLLFWLLIGGSTVGPAEKKPRPWPFWAMLLVFVFSNVWAFPRLLPVTGLKRMHVSYDYGFWYSERSDTGKEFRWTHAAAGLYLDAEDRRRYRGLRVYCGAPLEALPSGKQVVQVLWKGRMIHRIEFRKNVSEEILFDQLNGEKGFLEFRVRPTFNLKKIGRGEEGRTLGVQIDLVSNE